jgi:hypothetical protein
MAVKSIYASWLQEELGAGVEKIGQREDLGVGRRGTGAGSDNSGAGRSPTVVGEEA